MLAAVLILVICQIATLTAFILERSASRSRIDRTEGELAAALKEANERNLDLQGFAYIVSHDLQEPLRGIEGAAVVVGEIGAASEDRELQRWVSMLVKDVSRARRMVADILQLSRAGMDSLEAEWVDTRQVVADVLDGMREQVREANASVLVIGILPQVFFDRAMLERVLHNLISNAVKFRRPGVSPVVQISGRITATGTEVLVSDNGIGIPDGKEAFIFGVGKRLHHAAEYPGTGYGLAIVKRIVERSGGRIKLVNNVGPGATFQLTIPNPEV